MGFSKAEKYILELDGTDGGISCFSFLYFFQHCVFSAFCWSETNFKNVEYTYIYLQIHTYIYTYMCVYTVCI